VDWLKCKGVRNFFYWSWNPNSGDTGGILQDDWQTVSQDKYNNLKRLWDGSAVDANVCK
jgi:endoglucanase